MRSKEAASSYPNMGLSRLPLSLFGLLPSLLFLPPLVCFTRRYAQLMPRFRGQLARLPRGFVRDLPQFARRLLRTLLRFAYFAPDGLIVTASASADRQRNP